MTSSPAPRRRNRPGEGTRLRDDLVAAADSLIAGTGSTEAMTLRAVARTAGVTAPAIYAHFATRDALLAAVLEHRFAGLADALRSAGDDHSGPRETVQARALAYVRYASEHPAHYAALFGPEADHLGVTFDGSPGEELFALLLGPVTDIVTDHAPGEDPFALATDVWSALHGMVALRASQSRFPWPDEQTQVARLLDRLLPDAEVRPSRDRD